VVKCAANPRCEQEYSCSKWVYDKRQGYWLANTCDDDNDIGQMMKDMVESTGDIVNSYDVDAWMRQVADQAKDKIKQEAEREDDPQVPADEKRDAPEEAE